MHSKVRVFENAIKAATYNNASYSLILQNE